MSYVKIGGLKFKVKEVVGLVDGDNGLLGEINYTNQIIRLEKFNEPFHKDLVMLHEVMHGLITLGINAELGSDEPFIRSLSHGLYALMRDNPKLFTDMIQRKV